MFTGLIEGLGEILAASTAGGGLRLHVAHVFRREDLALGDSIAVDGICLTAEEFPDAHSFVATAGRETLERTTMGSWRTGRRVHLERAAALGQRMGGHLVQGHVDGTARIREVRGMEESHVIWLDMPGPLLRYVVQKGSLTVDGVSLTVNEVREGAVRVNLIPHTWAQTRFQRVHPGDSVNIEVDVIARYVERLLAPSQSEASGDGLLQRLQKNGFLG